MAVEVWDIQGPDGAGGSVLVSTTTGTVIGPIICTKEHADKAGYFDEPDTLEAFLVWLPLDPRKYTHSDLADQFGAFLTRRETRNDPEF